MKKTNNFCDIHTFEKYVLHHSEKYEQLYILSNNDSYGSTFLSRLSIFDDEKRGTVKQDKEKVNQILNVLMNCNNPKEKYMRLQELNVSEEEKRGIGSMLGMAIGDAMGARYEFKTARYGKIDLINMGEGPGGHFKLEPGQWTDDTSMGLCIADSLIMNNGKLDQHDIMHRFIAWWRGGYNNAFRYNKPPRGSVGLGGNISLALKNYIKHFQSNRKLTNPETEAGDKNTSGNGTIMRNAAIPICFHENTNLACEMARKQSLITHQGDEAKECCSLLTHIIVQLYNAKSNEKSNINNKDNNIGDNKDNNIDDNKDNNIKDKKDNYYDKIKKIILNNLGTNFDTDIESVKCLAKHKQEGHDNDRNWDWTVEQYFYSPTRTTKQRGYVGSYAMDNMAMSLNTIYQTYNFRDAIIRAVNIRGDSDSVASVVGQIAGALYPIETIPGDWIKAIYKWDHGEIALRGYMLARIGKSNNSKNVKNQKERLSYVVV